MIVKKEPDYKKAGCPPEIDFTGTLLPHLLNWRPYNGKNKAEMSHELFLRLQIKVSLILKLCFYEYGFLECNLNNTTQILDDGWLSVVSTYTLIGNLW